MCPRADICISTAAKFALVNFPQYVARLRKDMKIALISMPMVNLQYPSLGLTQLKSILDTTFDDRISCDIHYLYHDIANYLGVGLYNFLLNELNSGIGEWFFRQIAFPNAPDNADDYFKHYFFQKDKETEKLRFIIKEKRKGLDELFEHLILKYNLYDYQIAGFTSLFLQNVASLAMIRKLKEKDNTIITLMGGANVEFPMGIQILNNIEYVDYLFSGPALKSLPALIQGCLNEDYESCHDIKGIWTRKNVNKYSHTRVTDFSYGEKEDINNPIALDYDTFLDSYENHFPDAKSKPFLFFSTSQGCYWGERSRCTFCAQGGPSGNNMTFTCMDAENAINVIDSLSKYSGRAELLYATDSILPRHYPEEVFSNLKSAVPIHLELNVHYLDEKSIKSLSHAGVQITEAGIESLSTESLRLMRKGTTASKNLQFMMHCMMHDIVVTWNFLIGIPGEHENLYEKLYHDIPLLTHFPPGGITAVTFERFSEYYNHPEKYGLRLVPHKFYDFIYPFSKEAVSKMAYNFIDYGAGHYKKALNKWIDKLIERFNFWKSLWNRKNQTLPYLYFREKDKKNIIVDSRSGIRKEYTIGETSYNLLQSLRKPRKMKYLKDTYPNLNIGEEMEMLVDKGLIFSDEDRYFNIVFPNKPPFPTFFSK